MRNTIAIITKDINEDVLNYYNDLAKVKSFYLITPNKNIQLEKKFSKLKIFEDSDILNRKSHPYIEKTARPNWYYQQFLKYELVFFLDYDNVHIVDGDSFISESILLEEKKIFYTSKIIEENYTSFIKFFSKFKNITERSYITNQMNFSKKELYNMFEELSFKRNSWIKVVSEYLQKNHNNWFSEYQLYANFIIEKEKNVESVELKVFRRLDLINTSVKRALLKYPIVSFEFGHKTDLIRKLRARLYYILGINFG